MTALYEVGRVLVDPDPAAATARARRILALEAQLGIAVEPLVQDLVLGSGWLRALLNNYYALMFLPANLAFLGWVFLRHPPIYPMVRNAVLLVDGLGFAVQWAVPVAPPRLLPSAPYVSTLAAAGHPLAYTEGMGAITNPYAAMPSLHFGWALVVGGGVVLLSRSRWRWVAGLHPAFMLLAVVATGNHYLLDAAAGGALVLASAGAVLLARRWARRTGTCPSAPASPRGGAPGPLQRLVVEAGVCARRDRDADGAT